MNEPAPGSGHDTIIDLERRELLMILRSVQEARAPASDPAPEPAPGAARSWISSDGTSSECCDPCRTRRSVSDPWPADDIAWLD